MTTKADFLEKIRKIYGNDIEIKYAYDMDKEIDEKNYLERYKKQIKDNIYLIFQINANNIDDPYAISFEIDSYDKEYNKNVIINTQKLLNTLSNETDKLDCVINFAQDTILKAIKG